MTLYILKLLSQDNQSLSLASKPLILWNPIALTLRRLTACVNLAIGSSSVHSETEREDDEVDLQWAAIERLPTMKRVRMSLFDNHLR